MSLPKQLQNPAFRFVLLKNSSKVAFENGWQTKNYDYTHPTLKAHLDRGGNFGVIGGPGQLRIIDIDNKELAEKLINTLNTFAVKTCGGTYHFYFKSDYNNNHKLVGDKGEVRANNCYVVAPGCFAIDEKKGHKGKYTVKRDAPIMELTREEFYDQIKSYLTIDTSFRVINPETSKVVDKKSDKSRSGREWAEVCKLIRQGKGKEDVFKHMGVFAKWSQAHPSYRETTYNKALVAVNAAKVEPDKFKKALSNFTDRLQMADDFLEIQPVYYNPSKMWFVWDFKKTCWVKADEIDVLNEIDQLLKGNLDTVNGKIRNEIIEALRRRARLRKPHEPKKSWVQFKDKIIDISTGEIYKSTPKFFMTNPLPWAIGETEDTPTLDRLFKEWVVGDDQDESYIKTLYEMIAYSTLRHQFLQRIFAYTGSGSNGKGCFLKIVRKFLGDENVVSIDMKTLTKNTFASSELFNKQAVVMGEVDATDMKNTNLLKSLTGEDPIRYEFKGLTGFTDTSYCTCFIATNSLPVTPDKSDGFYRRWLQVKFPHTFPVGKDILAAIPDQEYNNLAKKCIRIAKHLYEKMQFTNEGNVEDRRKRYEAKSNPVMNLINQEFEDCTDQDYSYPDFCKGLSEFLKKEGLRELSKKSISQILKREGYIVKPLHVDRDDGSQTTQNFILNIKKKVVQV